MKTARIVSAALLLTAICGWVGPSLSQAPPAGTAVPGINVPGQPGLKTPSIPGVPQVPGMPQVPGVTQGVPGVQSPTGGAGSAGTAGSIPKGQDTQWAAKKCLNRGDNSLGTCQDVCRNLGVTRAADSKEYAGICNY